MLYRKVKFFVVALFCAALIAGAATAANAQDNTPPDNNAQTDAKPQIPAALIAKWKKEAAAGNAKAQFLLGNAYYNGNGVDQDYTAAITWWHKAADQGNLEAQRALDQLVPQQ